MAVGWFRRLATDLPKSGAKYGSMTFQRAFRVEEAMQSFPVRRGVRVRRQDRIRRRVLVPRDRYQTVADREVGVKEFLVRSFLDEKDQLGQSASTTNVSPSGSPSPCESPSISIKQPSITHKKRSPDGRPSGQYGQHSIQRPSTSIDLARGISDLYRVHFPIYNVVFVLSLL